MIILTDSTGQLGNQLFEFSTFIANSKEFDTVLYHLAFDDYKDYFEKKNISNKIRILNKNSFYARILRKLSRIFYLYRNNKYHLIGAGIPYDINKLNSKKKIIFKSGSWFIDFPHFYKYQNEIKKFFTPIPFHKDRIQSFVLDIKSKSDIVIGLHILRGDYKDFLDGKFYFENYVYYSMVKQLISEIGEYKNVAVIICSNENIDIEDFPGLNVYKGLNHFIEDMYTLAECDYIIGPPSTYTMWASFYGNKPLFKIRSKNQKICLSDFQLDYGY